MNRSKVWLRIEKRIVGSKSAVTDEVRADTRDAGNPLKARERLSGALAGGNFENRHRPVLEELVNREALKVGVSDRAYGFSIAELDNYLVGNVFKAREGSCPRLERVARRFARRKGQARQPAYREPAARERQRVCSERFAC